MTRADVIRECARVATMHAGDLRHFGDEKGAVVAEHVAEMILELVGFDPQPLIGRGILRVAGRWQCLDCLANGTADDEADEGLSHYANCPALEVRR